jgi:eukaryotic-like serine/threonine-protein kinase
VTAIIDAMNEGSADSAPTVLGTPVSEEPRDTAAVRAGASVGRYVILAEIARGGMGRVLRAYDPKLQREVALKFVRGDLLDPENARRLVAEARAMAKLSHPNVVAVYDVEELEDEQVVLVMEYVAGTTLRRWLREEGRTWQEVVRMFSASGRGLAAAHAAGLLHRDFKPANVLVGTDGVVKVTDFGLAKADAVSTRSGESVDSYAVSEISTQAGVVLGTPRYMAPEQHRGLALTPAADQYAFCVALWEGLCPEPPFRGEQFASDKKDGPPAWPNAAVPRTVADAVRRGLAPKPSDRWPGMDALLAVLDQASSKRRSRTLLGIGSVCAVLMGLAGWSWAVERAERCTGGEARLADAWDATRRDAVKTAVLGAEVSYASGVWERTGAALDEHAAAWAAMHTEACEATTVRGEQSVEVMDLRMACLHRAKVELQAVTRVLSQADVQVVRKADDLVQGLRPLHRCNDVEALRADVEPPLPAEADRVEAIRALLADAKAELEAGRYAAAEERTTEAKKALVELDYGPVRTEVSLMDGTVLEAVGRFEPAEAALRDALRLAAEWQQRAEMLDATVQLLHVTGGRLRRTEEALRYRELAEGLARGNPHAEGKVEDRVANLLGLLGRYDEAEAKHRAALAIFEKAEGAELLMTMALANLATNLTTQGKIGEAEDAQRRALTLRQRALGPEHPDVARLRHNLAAILFSQRKLEEAEAEEREALALRERALGSRHVDVASSRSTLATILGAQEKYADAEAEYRGALALFEETMGPEHPHVATTLNNLGALLREQGKHAEAETELRRALDIRLQVLGPNHMEVATTRNNIGGILADQGRLPEAEAELRLAVDLWAEAMGPEHPDVAGSRINLGTVIQARGRHAEALVELQNAVSVLEKTLPPEHPNLEIARTATASCLLELGRSEEALELARRAWSNYADDTLASDQQADTAFVLAQAEWAVATDREARARARARVEQCAEAYARFGPVSTEDLQSVRDWLAAHRN